MLNKITVCLRNNDGSKSKKNTAPKSKKTGSIAFFILSRLRLIMSGPKIQINASRNARDKGIIIAQKNCCLKERASKNPNKKIEKIAAFILSAKFIGFIAP